MRFTVKLGNDVVGISDIESGDSSMGCAYGKFVPTAAYARIQQHCIEHRENWKNVPGLTVEARGVCLECAGGFQIVDYSPELGDDALELHLLGITVPPYFELFPDERRPVSES